MSAEQKIDIHQATANRLGVTKDVGKRVNYAIAYSANIATVRAIVHGQPMSGKSRAVGVLETATLTRQLVPFPLHNLTKRGKTQINSKSAARGGS